MATEVSPLIPEPSFIGYVGENGVTLTPLPPGGPISELSIAPPLTLDNDDGRWKLNGVDADGKECSCIAKRARDDRVFFDVPVQGKDTTCVVEVITSEKKEASPWVWPLNLFF